MTLAPGFVAAAGLEPMTYFDSAAVIIGLVLVGRWLEARAKTQTAGAVRRLAGLQPRTARVVRDGREIDVALCRGAAPATSSAYGRARKCPSTAASSRAAPRWTSRC